MYDQIMRNNLAENLTPEGALFAEVWLRSKAVRNFTNESKRPCKCDIKGITPHQCRKTITVTKLADVPSLGSTLLEPWVTGKVKDGVRKSQHISVLGNN